MIATRLPADGGDTHPPCETERQGVPGTSTQSLAYASVAVENPDQRESTAAWLKRQARLDPPMQLATAERDAAPGEIVDPDATDITTVLSRDHNQVMALVKQLKTIPGVSAGGDERDQSRRTSIADMVIAALSKHEAAEGEQFWPAVRKLLDGGDDVAEQGISQEEEGARLLQELVEREASETRFDELVTELDAASRKHVTFEDKVLLSLALGVDKDELEKIGKKILRARRHAPTRPHPHAPKRHPFAVKAAGAPAAVIDRMRDAAGERPAQRRGKSARDLPPEHPADGTEKEQPECR